MLNRPRMVAALCQHQPDRFVQPPSPRPRRARRLAPPRSVPLVRLALRRPFCARLPQSRCGHVFDVVGCSSAAPLTKRSVSACTSIVVERSGCNGQRRSRGRVAGDPDARQLTRCVLPAALGILLLLVASIAPMDFMSKW